MGLPGRVPGPVSAQPLPDPEGAARRGRLHARPHLVPRTTATAGPTGPLPSSWCAAAKPPRSTRPRARAQAVSGPGEVPEGRAAALRALVAHWDVPLNVLDMATRKPLSRSDGSDATLRLAPHGAATRAPSRRSCGRRPGSSRRACRWPMARRFASSPRTASSWPISTGRHAARGAGAPRPAGRGRLGGGQAGDGAPAGARRFRRILPQEERVLAQGRRHRHDRADPGDQRRYRVPHDGASIRTSTCAGSSATSR